MVARIFFNFLIFCYNILLKMKKEENIEFSLCAIYKNEGALLENFIKHHKDLFEELILVDTGSTDDSNEIVKSCGLKYFYYKWDDNFSNARNASLSYASKPYIIVLDVDELFTRASLESLKLLIKSENKAAYSLKQINFSNEKTSVNWQPIERLSSEISVNLPENLSKISQGYIVSRLIRVFKNNVGVSFSGMIHEIVADSMEKYTLSSIKTDIPIFHFGWIDGNRSDKEKREKKERYNSLIEKAWKIEKTAKAAYYYLTILDSFEERLKLTFKLIKQFPKVKEFYGIRADSALKLKQYKRALSYAEKGLDIFKDDFFLLSVKAKSLNALLKPKEALKILEKITENEPENFINFVEKLKALILMGKKNEAEKIIKKLPKEISEIYKKELLSLIK